MRIAFDAKRAFNNHRGLGNYSRDTIRILSTQFTDNQYYLFSPKVDNTIPFQVNDNCQIVLPSYFWARSFPSVWRSLGITRELKRLQVDLYHGLSHELPMGIERTSIHTIVTIHDLIFLKFSNLYPVCDRYLYRKKYLYSCKIADKIIAISEQTRRDLLELTNVDEKKITVVYQGCNPIFKTQISDSQKENICKKYQLPRHYMLSVGALEPRKNHILILQAMAIGAIDFPLVIVGNRTSYAQILFDYIKEKGLQNRVFLLTDVPFADFPALYQSASLFIYPSLFEGFGIPLLEALTCKIPVIAATGSCLEESGGPDSIYVSPYDAEELSVAIDKVLTDSQLQEKMIRSGIEYAYNFSDENIAQKLWKVYNF